MVVVVEGRGVGGGNGNAPQSKTTEAIITLVKISATSCQRGRDRPNNAPFPAVGEQKDSCRTSDRWLVVTVGQFPEV